MTQFLDLALLSAVVLMWLFAGLALRDAVFTRSKDEELERLRRENRELKRELREEAERLRNHYEQLLKEAAIKNAMMRGLWEAYTTGKLHECYAKGGKIRVLADGVTICEMERPEESYAVRAEEVEEGAAGI